ncbi:hypothetical protein JP74_02670 [Devosia sp. 17-2-E-8]|nr:hypothetical protein JP74_02670 [Devosia sp. 17-2-E-8]
MTNWILFFAGLALVLLFSAALNAAVVGSLIAGFRRYLLGRLIGGAIKGTRIDKDATHRIFEALGFQTGNGGPSDATLERLRPRRWQEMLGRACYLGIALGFGLMAYAIVRH